MPDRPTYQRYYVIIWLTLAAALAYMCRNSIGIAESQIRQDLKLTLSQSGWFMGAFFWSYALFQVPTGALAQRYGTRVTLTFFVLAWSTATFLTSISPIFAIAFAAQLVMGIAQAGLLPAATNSMNHWMPMSQRSFGCGMLNVGMQIGAITAALLTGYLLEQMSWRSAFMLLTIPGIIWAAAFFMRFRDRPEQCLTISESELKRIREDRLPEQQVAVDEENAKIDWVAVLKHPVLWFLCAQQMCRSAGYMFFASWFPTFMQTTYGLSIKESGSLQAIIFASVLTGSLLGGLLTDAIWRRTGNLRLSRSGVGATALTSCGLLILASWCIEDPKLAVACQALGVFCAAFASPCMFATVIDVSGPFVPQIFGVVNMSGNLAVALCPILVGAFFENTENWTYVLLIFSGVYLMGGISWLFVDPRQVIHARKA